MSTPGYNPLTKAFDEAKTFRIIIDDPPAGGIGGLTFSFQSFADAVTKTPELNKTTGIAVVDASGVVEIAFTTTETADFDLGVHRYRLVVVGTNVPISYGPFVIVNVAPGGAGGIVDISHPTDVLISWLRITNTPTTLAGYGITDGGGGGGGGDGTTINTIKIDQTPAGDTYGLLAGTVNGSNAVFTVSNGSYATGTLTVLLNGQQQTQGSGKDWTETTPSSGTFTFATAPPTGSIVQAIYSVVETSAADLVLAGPATTSGLTMATARILGRTTASTGAIEEIAIGANLTLAAGVLSASGGGGGDGNIDGGTPDSVYGGTSPIDGGTP